MASIIVKRLKSNLKYVGGYFSQDPACGYEAIYLKFPKFQKHRWFGEGDLGVREDRRVWESLPALLSIVSLCQTADHSPAWYPFPPHLLTVRDVALFAWKFLFIVTLDVEFIE